MRGPVDGSRRITVRAHPMRILYLHQFFITRQGVGGTRSYEFARRFAARGHGVRMVTAGAAPGRWTGSRSWACGGYSDYVSATAVSYPRRMLAFARFGLAARRPRCAARAPTWSTPPRRRSRWRCRRWPPPRAGAPLVFEVRDLWPEAPIQMGALRHPLARRPRALERFVYASARA